ncbi:MAG: hypothetical protein GY841_01405 [FCB group bacterium]|nr:hypothetical protein [FCB group bacterium]
MKNASVNRLSVKIGALLVFAIVIFSGCSTNPTNPDVTQNEPRLLTRTTAFSKTLGDADMYVEGVIPTKEGGRLELFDVVMDVPAGAVKNDTLFSITIPDVNVFYNEFGTDGLVFDKPVMVTMSYRGADLSGINESSIKIAWLNESTGQFVVIPCTIDFENQVVIAELNHFSAYGLITDE